MKVKWSVLIPWCAVVILFIVIIFVASASGGDSTDNMVYMNPGNNIVDGCNSGGIRDSNGKYLNATKCYNYIGQTVADAKKDAATHGKTVTWSEMPKGLPNPNNKTNKNSCHPRADSDIVAAVSVNIPGGNNPSVCWLYSDSDVQLIYSPTANVDGGRAVVSAAPSGWGAAYDKRFAAVNLS